MRTDIVNGHSLPPMPRKRPRTFLDLQTTTALVLLSITFVASLRVDGELNRIPTPVLLLFLLPNLLAIRFVFGTIVTYLAFVAVTILHLVWLDASGRIPFSVSNVLKDYALYVSLIAVYIAFFSNLTWASLEKPAIHFFKSLTLIGLGFWFVSIGSGTSFGVDTSYPIPRLQSLVTEPSNTSHFLPGLLIYSLCQRWWGWSVTCAVAILCTFSPTVYLTLILAAVLLWSLTARRVHLLIVLALCTTAATLIVTHYELLVAALSEAGQLGQAAARILEGFRFIASDGQVGANSRADLIFHGVDFMNAYNLWWTGAGFGTSAYIGDAFNDGLLFDSNTWSSLVIWFGVLAVPIWLFVQCLAVRKQETSFMYILLVSLCVSNTLNGGGVWLQMFFATLIYLKLNRNLRASTL